MNPGEKRTGPAGNGAGQKSLRSTADSTGDADNLWRLAEQCPAEQLFALALGWRLGYLDGFDAGYRGAEREMELHWFGLALKVRQDAMHPTFAELQRRRGEVA